MARILVVGGGGFLGCRVVAELAARGFETDVGGRRGPVEIDLAAGSGLERLDGYDAIVNCADSIAAPADRAMARVLERGGLWLDAGAEPAAIARQLGQDGVGARGAVVLGLGLWPGLSNLLVADLAREKGGPLSLGIRVAPFSGAGSATVDLMRGAMLGARPAEEAMLRTSLGRQVDVRYLMPAPGRWLMAVMPRLRPRWLFAAIATGMTGVLRLVRTRLLRRRAAPIELCASAGDVTATLVTRDGFGATAAALATCAAALLERPAAPGLHTPDQVLVLDEVLARMPPGLVVLTANQVGRNDTAVGVGRSRAAPRRPTSGS